MKLSRRSFLGGIPGVVVGGRKIVDDAATAAAQKMALSHPPYSPPPFIGGDGPGKRIENARKELRRLLNPLRIERRKKELYPTRLDPDLAAMRSMSMSVKLLIQRERSFERDFDRRRTYLESVIAGLFDDEDDIYDEY